MMSWLHNWIWVQQDYFWFLAGIGWLSVGVLWWQHRRNGEVPGWIPWSAGAGVAIAVTQVLGLVTPVVHLVPNEAPSLGSEISLSVIHALATAGWWAAGLRQIRGGAVIAAVIGLVTLFAAGWRVDNPDAAPFVVLIVSLGAVAWWFNTREKSFNHWTAAMLATAAAIALCTTGPVAHSLVGVHRWHDVNPFGSWAAIAQGIAAISVLLSLRRQLLPGQRHRETTRVERWVWGGTAAWLVVGLALAVSVGLWGQRAFQQNALGRVRAAASLIPLGDIEALLDDRFQITEVETRTYPNGTSLALAYSEHAEHFCAPVTTQLTNLAAAHDDVRWVTLMTIRDGWLVGAAFANRPLSNLGRVTLYRPSAGVDEQDWAAMKSRFSGPVMFTSGATVFARAPLVGGGGQMLGWLDFSFGTNQWVAAQAQPRALAYLIIALGLIIGRQLVVQRHREQERNEAQAEASSAQQASQMKTTFLANVSHELRTPLQSIQGYTEMLLSQVSPRQRERLLAVRENADLMGRLVNDLIDLSAAESGKFHLIERPVALADLVVQAAESLRHRAEAKGLSFSVEVSPQIPGWLYADPQRVRQVVLNLVGNAIKYTDDGYVTTVLTLVGRDSERAEMELRVSDSGPGVPRDAQPYLFDAFHRLESTRDREGAGLGLAIVAAVSKAMGGRVRVESDGRTGSLFVARWRLRLAPAGEQNPRQRVALHGKRVLVVDDNALVRDLFVAYLTECGGVCATAGDGADAIRRMRGEEFDAVVLDLAMPKLDGLSVVRQVRREMPEKHWRIVGVSAHAGAADHDAALAAGMDAFLIKPVSLPELVRALAPSQVWTPPARSFDSLRAQFEHRFRADAPAQSAAVARALAGGQWPEIYAAAHYLKNSADVVGDGELAQACAALESAARARDAKAGDEAWQHCSLALARWLSEPTAN